MIGTLIAAWLDVRSRPFRTFAAIAGMVAAIVAVVLVDAATVLSHDANDAYLARQYGLPVTVFISSQLEGASVEESDRVEAMLRTNGVRALSRDVGAPATVLRDGQLLRSGMRWVSSAYRDIRIVDMVAGAWPTDTADSDVLHVVLHQGWAQSALGLSDQQAIGQVLQYSTTADRSIAAQTTPLRSMVIDGVVSTGSNAFTNGSSEVIIVSDRANPGLVPDIVSTEWVARVNPGDYGLLQDLVATVTDETGQAVFRVTRADATDTLAPVLNQQSVTAGAVTLVALAVGGMGILGVGIAGVRERAREFGLRRALGASRSRLFSGVILQTLLEVLLAALIAIPLAAILLQVYARDLVLDQLPVPPSTALPFRSALVGLTGAVAVGLLAGLIPAVNAARTSVVRALQG